MARRKDKHTEMLFDGATGHSVLARDAAPPSAAELIAKARRCAIAAAMRREDRTATIDDVVAAFKAEGIPPNVLGLAVGRVFLEADGWERIGEYVLSARRSSHARPRVAVWKLIRLEGR